MSEPVLSAEEWRASRAMSRSGLSARDREILIARHIDLLPDGHPLKITHEDLYWLGQACDYAERWGYNNPYSGAYQAADKARAFRDRLLALLPPKEGA